MVEVGVGEYPVDPAAHRPQLGHAALLEQVSQGLAWREGQHVRAGPDLDGDPAGEVLVAVEEAGGAVERVARVVDGRALLGGLVGGAQEDPLLGRRHLGARLGLALPLQHHGQPIQLHAELTQVLVFPHTLVLKEQDYQPCQMLKHMRSLRTYIQLSQPGRVRSHD